jgi:hypothetical protein
MNFHSILTYAYLKISQPISGCAKFCTSKTLKVTFQIKTQKFPTLIWLHFGTNLNNLCKISLISYFHDIKTITYIIRGTLWHSWLSTTLESGRSRARFPMLSLEFFIDIIFLPHYGPGVDSSSNRNEYQEYFLGGKGGWYVGLTTLSPSCTDCLEIWESQLPGNLRACPEL